MYRIGKTEKEQAAEWFEIEKKGRVKYDAWLKQNQIRRGYFVGQSELFRVDGRDDYLQRVPSWRIKVPKWLQTWMIEHVWQRFTYWVDDQHINSRA
jgi:hypothetical protein